MGIQSRQAESGQATHHRTQHRQGHESAVPAAMVGQEQTCGHAGHAGQGKRRHHKAGGATPPAGGFFDATATYHGAIAPTGTAWTAGWTSYSAN
jgi:hypothetical protein